MNDLNSVYFIFKGNSSGTVTINNISFDSVGVTQPSFSLNAQDRKVITISREIFSSEKSHTIRFNAFVHVGNSGSSKWQQHDIVKGKDINGVTCYLIEIGHYNEIIYGERGGVFGSIPRPNSSICQIQSEEISKMMETPFQI